jgi:hypothetical protein
MKNHCQLPPTTEPVDALPATRTHGGVTLTLQSLVVHAAPQEEQPRTQMRLTLPPDVNPKDWKARVQVFDQRRAPVSYAGLPLRTVQDGFSIETSHCFWSDSPWFVRVMLMPARGVKHPLCTEILLEDIPLPNHPTPVVPIRKTSGVFYVTPARFTSPSMKSNGRLNLAFDRVSLPQGSEFSIVSATDNLGRAIEWQEGMHATKCLANGDVCVECYFTGPGDLKASSVDMTVGFATPLVFDFHVMPEFVSEMERPESKKVSAATSR